MPLVGVFFVLSCWTFGSVLGQCDLVVPPNAPTEILIGGLFPLTGNLAAGGIPRSSAFRIAIEDINNDTCLLPGFFL